MKEYDHKKIESKWQKQWEEEGIYKVGNPSRSLGTKRNICYVLDMFPYPSGEGLHVGHPKGYIATDVYSRMKKMQGYNILHPMGWDAFGLPTENYAIKNKIHPRIATEKNVKRFKEQLGLLGFNYDWNREINTTDPEYYKWTQWIFLQMFKKGLAYQSYEPINWCPSCKTGLANEDLEAGRCERCGSVVEKKPMKQWMLKITDYAEQLLEGLDDLDWPEHIKELQRNWIGRSEGANLKFKVKNSKFEIEVFTTRPDTLFGATYMVVAPEHRLIADCKLQIANLEEVENYVEGAKARVEIERTAEGREKIGVELKGVTAINPANGEEIPIWVADYVLGSYGTGAIMAVPAHDERDFQFAKRFGLPIKPVICPVFGKEDKRGGAVHRNTITGIVRRKDGKILILKWKEHDWMTPIIGGIDEEEKITEAAQREVLEESGLRTKVVRVFEIPIESHFYAEHKKEWRSRLDHLILLEVIDEEQAAISEEEQLKHEMVWMTSEEALQKVSFSNNKFALEVFVNNRFAYEGSQYTERDEVVNSGKFDGMESEKAKWEITKFVGGKRVTKYKLRDWVFSRQRYWGEPIPIIHCEKCGAVAVPEEDLPVKLPEVKHYEPTGTGESPLANIKEWVHTKCPKCGGPGRRETNTMPQWAGSSWYYVAYAIRNSQGSPSTSSGNKDFEKYEFLNPKPKEYWLPVDIYVGGAEHATRHLIYARFWHKFLYDIGVVSTPEPFLRLHHVGLINGEDGRKMSKRYGNVINPDDIVAMYGADTMRLYEMFMGPFSDNIAWSTDGILGPRRFIERIWRFYCDTNGFDKLTTSIRMHTNDTNDTNDTNNTNNTNKKIERLLHKTIKKVTEDIEGFRFNTAVSALMIFFNEMEKQSDPSTSSGIKQTFLKLLAPFIPYMTEEVWREVLGHNTSIYLEPWPKYNPKMIEDETFQLVVQVNGKMRGMVMVEKGISQEVAERLARADAGVLKYLGEPFGGAQGKKVKKVIFVKDKLINFVV